jgi:hypothetical protein
MISPWPPTFEPLAPFRHGPQQTLAAYCPWTRQRAGRARRHRVPLADEDQVVLHDDCPGGWRPGHGVALLVPGLGGCHMTPYLVRSAANLNRRGTRTSRMDQRTFGSAAKLARWPHHAGRSGDVETSVATGESKHSGRQTAVACGQVWTAEGVMVASGSATFMHRDHADASAGRIAASQPGLVRSRPRSLDLRVAGGPGTDHADRQHAPGDQLTPPGLRGVG